MTAPFVIVGATGGVGEALARRVGAAGAKSFLIARNPARLEPLAASLGARYAVADVLETDALASAVAEAENGGGIAGLAYCVGSIVLKPLKSATEADFLEAFRLNAVGAAIAIKAAETGLKAAGGSVVLFSTVAVAQGFANHAVIGAAKGAIEGMVRAMAAELAPKVRVNAVAPSLTRTPLGATLLGSDAMAASIAGLHALQRLGTAEDQAAAAWFLLSPDSSWITGQVLGVDGGRATLRTRG